MGDKIKSGSQCSICGIYYITKESGGSLEYGYYKDGKYICQSCRTYVCNVCGELLDKNKNRHFIKMCESCVRDYKIDEILPK